MMARALLLAGADKVAVNSAAVARPELAAETGRAVRQPVRRRRDRRARRRRRRAGRCSPTAAAARPASTRWPTPRGSPSSAPASCSYLDGPRRHARRLRPRADPRDRRRGAIPVIASGGVGKLDHLVAGVVEGARRRGARGLDLPLRPAQHRRGARRAGGAGLAVRHWSPVASSASRRRTVEDRMRQASTRSMRSGREWTILTPLPRQPLTPATVRRTPPPSKPPSPAGATPIRRPPTLPACSPRAAPRWRRSSARRRSRR